MLTYTRKPTQVKAVQLTQEILDELWLVPKNPNENPISLDVSKLNLKKVDWNWHTKELLVPTKENRQTVGLNDWIVQPSKERIYKIYSEKSFRQKFTRLDSNYSNLKELVCRLNEVYFIVDEDVDNIDLEDYVEYQALQKFADSPNEII